MGAHCMLKRRFFCKSGRICHVWYLTDEDRQQRKVKNALKLHIHRLFLIKHASTVLFVRLCQLKLGDSTGSCFDSILHVVL